MTRWPTYVDNAIREAHAGGDKPTVALSKLRAGTLAGLDGRPIAIKDRTFWNKWKKAKEEQRQAENPALQGAPCEPGILTRIAVDLAISEHGADPDDPEGIAESLGLTAGVVRECIEIEAQKRDEHERASSNWTRRVPSRRAGDRAR